MVREVAFELVILILQLDFQVVRGDKNSIGETGKLPFPVLGVQNLVHDVEFTEQNVPVAQNVVNIAFHRVPQNLQVTEMLPRALQFLNVVHILFQLSAVVHQQSFFQVLLEGVGVREVCESRFPHVNHLLNHGISEGVSLLVDLEKEVLLVVEEDLPFIIFQGQLFLTPFALTFLPFLLQILYFHQVFHFPSCRGWEGVFVLHF